MEAILFGMNLLIGYAIWHFIWRKSALDKYRDMLFDLRDEVKTYFIDHGYALDHPLYSELRSLLNAHIRYTEKLTLRLFMAETVAMNAHPSTARELKDKLNRRFITEDANLASFIKDIRTRAVVILTGHMAETSFIFLLLYPLMYVFAVLVKAYSFIKTAANHNARKLFSGAMTVLKFAPLAGFMLAIPARAGIIDAALDTNIVEEYSYQAAHD